ncbi:SulP family inorganic anion transporter [Streptomyces vinaceus]|uniref:SulP family inorganic anion transporter n=1 Tax=Streptomyces vinaceus TaxID=1960 RepID=UPI0035DB52E9
MFSTLKNPAHLRQDLLASLVVFLVALPLCVGVAVASGVPAELGLVTGIVGGLVVGCLPGSSLQVSGPAAGLTVLVFEAVQEFGLGALGVVVLLSGLAQLAMGVLRFGRFFRAITVAVVQGMLAGIGLVLIFGQLYTMAGVEQPRSGLGKIAGIPGLAAEITSSGAVRTSFAVGAATIAVLVLWRRLPSKVQAVPAPLAAVALATAVTAAAGWSVPRVDVQGLLAAIQPPGLSDFASLGSLAAVGTIIAFALIASAESLFSAAAVDRMHDGPRTDFDKELMAQGAGNAICGLLGALPLTAVIVRSAANVQAGAQTKLSRVLHGLWLVLFAALLPAAIGVIPLAALAGVLVHAGCKLIPVKDLLPLWRSHRGEALVLAATAIAIIVTNMFEGVLFGIALAVAKSAWETSHVRLDVHETTGGRFLVTLSGSATFLRLPRMLETLEALPPGHPVELDLSGLRHVDHACRTTLEGWAQQRGVTVEVPARPERPSGPSGRTAAVP